MAGRHRESAQGDDEGLDVLRPRTSDEAFAAQQTGAEIPVAGAAAQETLRGAGGRSWVDGIVRRLRHNGGLVVSVGAAATLVVLTGGSAIARHFGGDSDQPAPRVTVTRAAPPPVRPRPPVVYPTYGEYVPPRPVPTYTRRAPTVTKTPEPSPSRRACPPSWKRNPWLWRWCKSHGFETDNS